MSSDNAGRASHPPKVGPKAAVRPPLVQMYHCVSGHSRDNVGRVVHIGSMFVSPGQWSKGAKESCDVSRRVPALGIVLRCYILYLTGTSKKQQSQMMFRLAGIQDDCSVNGRRSGVSPGDDC